MDPLQPAAYCQTVAAAFTSVCFERSSVVHTPAIFVLLFRRIRFFFFVLFLLSFDIVVSRTAKTTTTKKKKNSVTSPRETSNRHRKPNKYLCNLPQ